MCAGFATSRAVKPPPWEALVTSRSVLIIAHSAGGAQIGNGILFSTGATHPDRDPRYLHDAWGLQSYALMLQQAGINARRVEWTRCGTRDNDCLAFILIRADTQAQ